MSLMTAFNPSVQWAPSPNFSDRRGYTPRATVIHYTGSGPGAGGDIAWFQNPDAKVSAHFIVGRDGVITQMVDLDKAAWHAGASAMPIYGKVLTGCNLFTIGIELDNIGYLTRDADDKFFYEAGGDLRPWQGVEPVKAQLTYDNGVRVAGWWEPFADAQIAATLHLLDLLSEAGYAESAKNCVGHEEVATPFATRKRDPGPLFPWEKFPHPTPARTARQLLTT